MGCNTYKKIETISRFLTILTIVASTSVAFTTDATYTWRQTDWSGGPNQQDWFYTTQFYLHTYMDYDSVGELKVAPVWWRNAGELEGAVSIHSMAEMNGTTYAGGSSEDAGCVFKTEDGGVTWDTTHYLPGAKKILSLLPVGDTLFAAGYDTLYYGQIFYTTDGDSWILSGQFELEEIILHLYQGLDGTLYGCSYGKIFSSTNGGQDWSLFSELSPRCYAMLQTSQNTFFVGGDGLWRSTDACSSWSEVLEVSGGAYALIQVGDSLYAGTSTPADCIWRSIDGGNTWQAMEEFPVNFSLRTMTYSNGVFYIGGYKTTTAHLGTTYRSVDFCNSWEDLGIPPGAETDKIFSILVTSSEDVYLGSSKGEVFKKGTYYYAEANLISSIYFAFGNQKYGEMRWAGVYGGTETITVKVRTDSLPDMSAAFPWDSCPPVENGQDISDLASVSDDHLYAQYYIKMNTSTDNTPVLDSISLDFKAPTAFHYVVYDPDPDTLSGPVIHKTLSNLGYGGVYTSNLDPLIPYLETRFKSVFVCCGHFPNTYQIRKESRIAEALEAYLLAQKGRLYLEGGDVWKWDVEFKYGYDFNPLFGDTAINDPMEGVDIEEVRGLEGTEVEGMNFDYLDYPVTEDADYFASKGCTMAFVTPEGDSIGHYYVNDSLDYRTWGFSGTFGSLKDSTSPSTKADLAVKIMEFFDIPPGVHEEYLEVADGIYALYQNVPNPARRGTRISYCLPKRCPVRLSIYDATGRLVRNLVNDVEDAGLKLVSWDGADSSRKRVSSGVYFYILEIPDHRECRKMIWLK